MAPHVETTKPGIAIVEVHIAAHKPVFAQRNVKTAAKGNLHAGLTIKIDRAAAGAVADERQTRTGERREPRFGHKTIAGHQRRNRVFDRSVGKCRVYRRIEVRQAGLTRKHQPQLTEPVVRQLLARKQTKAGVVIV